MPSEPRTLFVIVNDKHLKLSEPHTTLFHDQWFIKSGLTNENNARRFIDMHVRGYYREGRIHFYRCPTFIYDDKDIEVMLEFIDSLIAELKKLKLIESGQKIELNAGRSLNKRIIKEITVE